MRPAMRPQVSTTIITIKSPQNPTLGDVHDPYYYYYPPPLLHIVHNLSVSLTPTLLSMYVINVNDYLLYTKKHMHPPKGLRLRRRKKKKTKKEDKM